MNEVDKFQKEVEQNISGLASDPKLVEQSQLWLKNTSAYHYTYNFRWMGRPIIQLPQDIIAMQEIIWSVQPQAIVETGIAHGGSTVFYASMLELLGGDRKVIAVDIDIRSHNRNAIESHPLARRIELVEGSSTDSGIVSLVRQQVGTRSPVVVALDSNHTELHVLEELRLYSPMVTKGSYLVVFDTIIEDMPDDFFPNRPWKPGNSPKSAVHQFLRENDRFLVDRKMDAKLLLSAAPEGYLQCVKD